MKPKRNKLKLEKHWTHVFASKFDEMVPGCVFKFEYHKINKKKIDYVSYFIAKAYCKHPGCGTFKFNMKRKHKKRIILYKLMSL